MSRSLPPNRTSVPLRHGWPRAAAPLLIGLLAAACAPEEAADPPKDNGAVGTEPGEPVELPDPSYDLDHDGFTEAQGDCDDNDGAVFPDQDELCDGKDNNCNGTADEGWDVDGDGHLPMTCAIGDDCNDNSAAISPSAVDVPYDGVDQDCDGVDNLDADDDGFDSNAHGGNDCNDTVGSIYPGAPEVAKDGIDQDCDGEDSLDADLDGHDDAAYGGLDCDDEDPAINPDAFDFIADGTDSDCDTLDGAPVDWNSAPVVITGASSRSDLMGRSVVLCDVDGDGQDDMVVGAPQSSSNRGEVGVWFGSESASWTSTMSITDADIRITGSTVGFGVQVRCGDINGDGDNDLLIARPEYSTSYDHTIYYYSGGGGWASTLTESGATASLSVNLGAPSGSTLWSWPFEVGDLDGDGMAELLFLGISTGSLNGPDLDDRLWIVPGGDWSGALSLSSVVERRLAPADAEAITGFKVVDDLNGDGDDELVVESGDWVAGGAAAGSVAFLSGMPLTDGAVDALAWASLVGTSGVPAGVGSHSQFGDFDGDGRLDAVLAAPYTTGSGRSNAGAVLFYSDLVAAFSGTGLDAAATADVALAGAAANGYLGAYGAEVGDVDGDGHDDLFVVEVGGGTGGRGRSLVLSGDRLTSGATPLDSVRIVDFTHPNSYTGVGTVVGAGDLDGDGYVDFLTAAPSYGLSSGGSGFTTGRVYLWPSSALTHIP